MAAFAVHCDVERGSMFVKGVTVSHDEIIKGMYLEPIISCKRN
jgi:hypothetical protein